MKMLCAALIATVSGCAPHASRFQTSDAPPPMPSPEPPLAYEPPVSHLPVSRAELLRTSAEFFLALETQSALHLEQLLTRDALLRRHTTGVTTPALPGLLEISEAWSPSALGAAPARSTFGPVTVVDVRADADVSSVTVEVARPKDIQGSWKLRFNESGLKPLIQEVVLPPLR